MMNGPLILASLFLLLLIGFQLSKIRAAGRVFREPNEIRVSADLARARHVALRVIADMRHTVDRADERSITFKTRTSWRSWTGQTMSVTFSPIEDGGTEVAVTSQANPSFQIYDWHEGAYIAQRFLARLRAGVDGTGAKT